MSTDSHNLMIDEPLYNLYRYSFQNEKFFQGNSSFYAQNIVTQGFDASRLHVATEGSIVLNLWMFIVHKLYETVHNLENGDPGLVELDEAFTLWVGLKQEEGFNDGFLMYNIAENAESYIINDPTDANHIESKVNKNIIELFKSARVLVNSIHTDRSGSLDDFRVLMNRLIGQMTIPLVQRLIYHISTDKDDGFIKLYGLSILPLIAGCSPSSYDRMNSFLIDEIFDDTNVEEILNLLESSYNCLQISCDAVEFHDRNSSSCVFDIQQIAGYTSVGHAYEV